jgi:predicted porin
MIKTAIVLLAAGAAASASHAQSSVTVFGVVDLAVRNVDNQGFGSSKSLVNGANQTSRVGFRGVEDLGGGLSAGFWLESTLNADSGTAGQTAPAGQFWDRRSTLSLSSTRYGELRAGRDFVPTYSSWGRYDPFGYVGVGSAGNFITASQTGPIRSAFSTSPNTTVRSSNALQILLPADLGGFQGGLMVAPGEGGTAAAGQHKHKALRVGYAVGGLAISAATATTQNDITGSNKFKDSVIAGAYDFGIVKVSGGVRRFSFANASQRNYLLGVTAPVGAGQIIASYNKADESGKVGTASIDRTDATQWALGYVHNLSKRTALYSSCASVDNGATATYSIAGGPAGLAAGHRSTGFEAGVRHNF